MKILALAALWVAGLSAQPVSAVRDVSFGCQPNAPCVTLLDYSGTSLVYTGSAPQAQPSNSWLKRTDSTLTNIVVSSNTATVTCATACGVWKGQRVIVSGATVDTDLNATYTVTSDTSTSATTFTFTTVAVANATYTESTLVISTSNPLTTQALWIITCLKYDASSNLIATLFANSSTATALAWSSRATY